MVKLSNSYLFSSYHSRISNITHIGTNIRKVAVYVMKRKGAYQNPYNDGEDDNFDNDLPIKRQVDDKYHLHADEQQSKVLLHPSLAIGDQFTVHTENGNVCYTL